MSHRSRLAAPLFKQLAILQIFESGAIPNKVRFFVGEYRFSALKVVVAALVTVAVGDVPTQCKIGYGEDVPRCKGS